MILETKQKMYVKRNIKQHSLKHCCRLKVISVKYSECLCVALAVQHAKRVRHIVTCSLSGCTTFFHIILKSGTFSKERFLIHKMCFDFLYHFVVNISHSKPKTARYCHTCKNAFMQYSRFSYHILIKLDASRQIVEE